MIINRNKLNKTSLLIGIKAGKMQAKLKRGRLIFKTKLIFLKRGISCSNWSKIVKVVIHIFLILLTCFQTTLMQIHSFSQNLNIPKRRNVRIIELCYTDKPHTCLDIKPLTTVCLKRKSPRNIQNDTHYLH